MGKREDQRVAVAEGVAERGFEAGEIGLLAQAAQ